MKLPRRHLIWLLPSGLLVLFLLFGVLADAWLESSGGRQMLERELSKSLGSPVRLEGDFHLKLIPRLKVAGSRLRLGQQGGTGVWVFCKDYSAAVELMPLVHREVRIASIVLHGGSIGFGSAGDEAGDETRLHDEHTGPVLTLPQVASLEITDFQVALTQADSGVSIERLRLVRFEPGREAGLEIDAGLSIAQHEPAHLHLQGALTVENNLSSRLDIHAMSFDLNGSTFTGLTGAWQWDQQAVALKGQMVWEQAPHMADLSIELASMTPPGGTLNLHYRRQQLIESSSLAADFAVLPDRIRMQSLEIGLDGQYLKGGGCLLLAETPALNLSLQAGDIDLDKVYSAVSSVAPSQRDGNAELPVELAIRISAENAWIAGAQANDVEAIIGAEPDCPVGAGSGS